MLRLKIYNGFSITFLSCMVDYFYSNSLPTTKTVLNSPLCAFIAWSVHFKQIELWFCCNLMFKCVQERAEHRWVMTYCYWNNEIFTYLRWGRWPLMQFIPMCSVTCSISNFVLWIGAWICNDFSGSSFLAQPFLKFLIAANKDYIKIKYQCSIIINKNAYFLIKK